MIHLSGKRGRRTLVQLSDFECPQCTKRHGNYVEDTTRYKFMFFIPFVSTNSSKYVCTDCNKTSDTSLLNPEAKTFLQKHINRSIPFKSGEKINLFFLLTLLLGGFFIPSLPFLLGLSIWTTYGKYCDEPSRSLIKFTIFFSVSAQLILFDYVFIHKLV